MKKRRLSMLMAISLMLSVSPTVWAAESSDSYVTVNNEKSIIVTNEIELANAVSSQANYELVTLGNDITLTNTLTVSSGTTISGGTEKYGLTYDGTAANGAIVVDTSNPVVMDSLTINVKQENARGIKLATSSPKFTLSNSTLNVCLRGIWVGGSCDSNSVITVSNSVIQNNQIPDDKTYDNWAYVGDARGIALFNMDNSQLNILNSDILGFGYSINLAGTPNANGIRDYNNTEIHVTNSNIKGWTAFNVWSAKTNFIITNSTLVGINTSDGSSDGFATIVVNDDIYNFGWGGADANTFNIYGGTISCYRSGTASEKLFRVDDHGITKVNFAKNKRVPVTIIDGTGDSQAVFYSGYLMMPNNWIQYMEKNVSGKENCTLKGYEGKELLFIPIK